MTTVSKLLSNDMFDEMYDVLKDQYDECMQYYIRGQYKQCLEAMFKYDLIKTERGKQLFINCCYKIPSFHILGRSFNPILDDFFGVQKWEEYTVQLNMDAIKDIALINQILKCCYKWLQWTESDKVPMVVETYLQFIEAMLSKFLKESNGQVDAIYELITFYITEVKISLLNEPRSISLYTDICQKYPSISSSLNEKSVLGPTYEECIKSKLKPKILLSKTKKTYTSKDMNDKKQNKIKREENIDIRKPAPITDHTIEEEGNNDDNTIFVTTSTENTDAIDFKNIIYRYKKLTYHYLQVLKNSPYKKFVTVGLMVILLVVYKSRKYIKKISSLMGRWLPTLLSILDQY